MTPFCHKEKHFVRTSKGTINANKEQRNESEKSSPFFRLLPRTVWGRGLYEICVLHLTFWICLLHLTFWICVLHLTFWISQAAEYRDWKFLSFISLLWGVYGVIQCVPLATEPGIFFNNFTTNEDIATKFEADSRHILLHFSHNERTPVQISLQYLHWSDVWLAVHRNSVWIRKTN